jgi:transposase
MTKAKPKNDKRQYHTREFKTSAVQMVVAEGLEVKDVASRLGVDPLALRRWVANEEKSKMSKDQAAIKELLLTNKKQEEEIRRLKMEREILKKAMAYFVPHQT